MAAPKKSGWGSSFLAGLESKLDTILAEDAGPAKTATTPAPAIPAKAVDSGVSRTASNASTNGRTNDRLQERLARAMAAKNAAQKGGSSNPSRTATPVNQESPRASIDEAGSVKDESVEAQPMVVSTAPGIRQAPTIEILASTPATEKQPEVVGDLGSLAAQSEETPARRSTDSTRSYNPRQSIDSVRSHATHSRIQSRSSIEPVESGNSNESPDTAETLLAQLKSDYETSELQRQEEVHGYIERIDALQAKLQYLAKESAESAKKASNDATSGSLEKKLADKDEQIALLMEEGQKLSKKELNQLTTIKKLRAKAQEDNRELAEARRQQEQAEKDAAIIADRLKRAEGAEKRVAEKQKIIIQAQKDMDSLRAQRDARDSVIAGLKSQLEEAAAEEKREEAKLTSEALAAEKRKVSDLEDDVANLKIEKTLVADRAQAQIKELREKIEKDAERARITELEMKTEQQMLESKLEVMRARAEEVSTGATGDAQAKLLRQIETLQTQYAVTSENFQSIEASLIARAANLEKERDEATRREAEIRKKAREVTLKAKKNEDELEETKSKWPTFQQELDSQKVKLDKLQQRAEAAEAALVEARAKFDQEKKAWDSEILQRVDEERQKWQEEAVTQRNGRSESPAPSTRRTLTSEYLGLQNLAIRRASSRSINGDVPPTERFLPRRPSAQPLRSSGHGTPTRQDSGHSLITNGEPLGTPSFHADHDDFFEQTQSPTSQHQTLNDMVSTSTVAAGPSVQLVERMSSAVRKLENEKVATKDQLARLSAQRDEARAEIVTLMREVQSKRALDIRVAELEKEVEETKKRHEMTLEMLGEKTERVQELQEDIDDIKAMHRQLLLERTAQ